MKPQMHRGFSLLELLVALFVVVIITSLVSLAVNSGGQEIQLEAKVRSLADISSYALDEAQMRGVDMGLLIERIDEAGDERYRYSWRERMPEGWRRPVVDAEIFGDQQFPVGVELALELEDIPLTEFAVADLADESSEADQNIPQSTPQILFYSSGEVSAGAIDIRQLETGDLLWRIEWDLLGRFTLLRRGEATADDFDNEHGN